MSGRSFVDSNILIYTHDLSAGTKHEEAVKLLKGLWEEKRAVLSTQVLQEFCVNVRRKSRNPVSWEELRSALQDYVGWETVVNTSGSILRALEIERRYQISFWDAMIVQAAESANCEVLYSEDFSHGQEYCGVLAVNPFVK
jgi:predicted nucleic acid-binding protein